MEKFICRQHSAHYTLNLGEIFPEGKMREAGFEPAKLLKH